MKKILLPFLFSFALAGLASAAESTNRFRIPHALSFEFGYKWNVQSAFSNLPAGGPFGAFEYAWQMSGYAPGKPAVYLGLPLRWATLLDGTNQFGQTQILSYGFTIRHQLKSGRWRPFLAYNLLLNQLTPDGLQTNLAGHPGRIMGHETKFDAGLELLGDKPEKGMGPAGRIQLSGSLTTFPSLTEAARSVWSIYASASFWLF